MRQVWPGARYFAQTVVALFLLSLCAFLVFLAVLLITASETLAMCLPAIVLLGAWCVIAAARRRRLNEPLEEHLKTRAATVGGAYFAGIEPAARRPL